MRAALVALLLTGCGVPVTSMDGSIADEDAGTQSDAGTTLDAGTSQDAGASQDAGTPQDAGTQQDAGTPSDAGIIDAGTSTLAYPVGTKHSPLTNEVVAHLRAIAALNTTRAPNVLSKVGDSNTVNTGYLNCFAGSSVDLAGRTSLDAALTHFRGGMVQGSSAFTRTSQSATIGWSAQSAVAGTPSPLQQEVDTANPRYATVMFGTNDVGFMNPDLFGRSMFTIIDTLSMQGVVPIITSVPPRDDSTTADAWVPRYNLIARGIAQARKIPFVDLNRELLPVPAHGLSGDGVHLSTYFTAAGARGCVFTTAGLHFGQNVRNLATLEALDRAWRAVETNTASDTTAPRIVGSGLPGDEVVIGSLPFVDARDTRTDGAANIASYPGCNAVQSESGREVLYRLEVTQAINLRAFVISLGTSDVDIHLLSSPSGSACLARSDKVLTRAMTPGTYWLSLDTFEGSSGALPGEYLLVVMAE
ncbi:MAG: SGNH/GDSL hydrolase family protein [Archangium sp.]